MGAAETPRRRRRAARRAAGPPAQASTTPVAELSDDAEPAERGVLSEPAELADVAGTTGVDAGTGLDAGKGGGREGSRDAVEPHPVGLPSPPDTAQLHDVVHGSPGDAPAGPAHTPGPPRDRADRAPGTGSPAGEPIRRSGRTSREEASERSLRSLVTTRSTQVSTTAALRAREVALPSDADLAAAAEGLVMVRRHYVPPTELSTGRRPDRTGRRPSGQDG